jgi:hypothetical protein
MAGLVLVASVLVALLIAWLARWRLVTRAIVAVLAGYLSLLVPFILIVTLLADAVFSPAAQFSARFILFLLGIAAVGLLGGVVTARVAGRRPVLHAAGLAAFLTAFATISLTNAPETEPRWTRIVTQAVLVPAVLLGGFAGGRLRVRR